MKVRAVPGLAAKAIELEVYPGHGCERGDFEIETTDKGQRYLWLACPGKCQTVAPLALRPSQVPGDSWDLSGTPEAPTLRPSINHVGCWHGWLTDGELTAC